MVPFWRQEEIEQDVIRMLRWTPDKIAKTPVPDLLRALHEHQTKELAKPASEEKIVKLSGFRQSPTPKTNIVSRQTSTTPTTITATTTTTTELTTTTQATTTTTTQTTTTTTSQTTTTMTTATTTTTTTTMTTTSSTGLTATLHFSPTTPSTPITSALTTRTPKQVPVMQETNLIVVTSFLELSPQDIKTKIEVTIQQLEHLRKVRLKCDAMFASSSSDQILRKHADIQDSIFSTIRQLQALKLHVQSKVDWATIHEENDVTQWQQCLNLFVDVVI